MGDPGYIRNHVIVMEGNGKRFFMDTMYLSHRKLSPDEFFFFQIHEDHQIFLHTRKDMKAQYMNQNLHAVSGLRQSCLVFFQHQEMKSLPKMMQHETTNHNPSIIVVLMEQLLYNRKDGRK